MIIAKSKCFPSSIKRFYLEPGTGIFGTKNTRDTGISLYIYEPETGTFGTKKHPVHRYIFSYI